MGGGGGVAENGEVGCGYGSERERGGGRLEDGEMGLGGLGGEEGWRFGSGSRVGVVKVRKTGVLDVGRGRKREGER